ncbi:(+)-neomenthol dehydrogenase-like [Silene latifolia]|uniref:(+)-neomenthol dehydrogenase-like n=1 Tax=Silene latifolia TaxID=37657 RepID=UPI003D786D0C
MGEPTSFLAKKRYAVVTGANKGIGLQVCRQLASQGVFVVLTSRDEKRGLHAIENLKNSGISSENLEFHQLDVTDPTTVTSLADFIKGKFGKLDILVNNAGILGAVPDFNALFAAGFPEFEGLSKDMITQTYEQAQECLNTNYFGVKTTTKALLDLLKLSDSPRIINVSSLSGLLSYIKNERIRGVLDNVDELTEDKIDEIVKEFLIDFKEGTFTEKGWIPALAAYFASKAVLNAYTRVVAKENPSIIVNCLCPGFIATDINGFAGDLPIEEGAGRVVRQALVPHGSPSGLYFINDRVTPF